MIIIYEKYMNWDRLFSLSVKQWIINTRFTMRIVSYNLKIVEI
jgi:hypothetical protein